MKIKETVKSVFPFLSPLNERIKIVVYSYELKKDPVKLTKRIYEEYTGKKLNLENPRDLNEKIQWLKLYSDTSMWPLLADKYRVRTYIEQNGYGSMLNEIYGVWSKADEIDFSELPDQFVLKTNNGYGDVIVIRDKSKMDQKSVRNALKKNLSRKFGVLTAEPHYLKIEPRIICEKLLENTEPESSSIIDYKFTCTYGEIVCLLICYDRDAVTHRGEAIIYSIDPWEPRLEYTPARLLTENSKKVIPRPQSLDQMMETAKVLSKPFPHVRVDFYDVDGKAIFGEMTFTPSSGRKRNCTDEFLLETGDKIRLY